MSRCTCGLGMVAPNGGEGLAGAALPAHRRATAPHHHATNERLGLSMDTQQTATEQRGTCNECGAPIRFVAGIGWQHYGLTPPTVSPHRAKYATAGRIEDVNAARIAALEEQGMSHSDAAAVAMAEDRDYEAQAIAEVIEDDGSLDEYRRASHASRAADLDLVAQDWGIAGPSDTLEALAARFERNAADWRQVRGQPDLNDVKGAGYAAGMAEAYMLAAADIRRTLRGDDPPGWDGAGADVEAQRG